MSLNKEPELEQDTQIVVPFYKLLKKFHIIANKYLKITSILSNNKWLFHIAFTVVYLSILLNHIYECTFQYNRVGVLDYFHLTIPVTKKNLSILMNIQKHVKMFITIFNKFWMDILKKRVNCFLRRYAKPGLIYLLTKQVFFFLFQIDK